MTTIDFEERDSYINPNIVSLVNNEIIEYDMKEAGFSLTKEFKLLDSGVIENLAKLSKEKRRVELGKIQRDDKRFNYNLNKIAFPNARKRFYIMNDLDESNILSVKKDAIFTMKKCNTEKVGDCITFRPKNSYSSYIQLPKRIELYYSPRKLDIKGIGEDNIILHEEYLIAFINKFFNKLESDSKPNIIKFLRRFIDKYKRKELDIGYYRTFDSLSKFYTLDGEGYTKYAGWDIEDTDISWNYFNVLMKFIQIPFIKQHHGEQNKNRTIYTNPR